MCSTIWFLYRCGCLDTAVFPCPHHGAVHHRRRRVAACYLEALTRLDETCHDCARGFCLLPSRSPSPPPPGVLEERHVNLATERAPSPGMGTGTGVDVLPAVAMVMDLAQSF
ncbi:hypothetical protein GGR53DRAFT_238492 [Hypoxylon sp. FL1150]|nr:hypothetical protein GGR53DRAFT_238492 [Hypoxylon sp. FL1150]